MASMLSKHFQAKITSAIPKPHASVQSSMRTASCVHAQLNLTTDRSVTSRPLGLGLCHVRPGIAQHSRKLLRALHQHDGGSSQSAPASFSPTLHTSWGPRHHSFHHQSHRPLDKAEPSAQAGTYPTETVHPECYDTDNDSSSSNGKARMSASEREQQKRELHSLNVAIGANIVIMVAKVWVHLISGSSSMLAEAMHSVADILNQILLRVGVLKAMKAPSPQHQYGYMRDRFVWSLISAVGIFFLGAGASVIHGLHTLTETRVLEGAGWSYAVLGVSALLEGYSLWVASKYVVAGAAARRMPVLQYIKAGVDPTTVAVMMEDGGAVAGLLIAGVCTALAHATGNAMWDAAGSIAVGGLLGLIAVFLVQKNRDLLLGRSMNARETKEVLDHLAADPVVLAVSDTKSEEVGPRVYRFKAEVAWNSDALVDKYLKRCGREALAQRLKEAIVEEERAAAAAAASQSSNGAAPVTSTSGQQLPLDCVLKAYTRSIISSVGAEVDRIEAEIQAINPGIRWVDLETDRGRVPIHIVAPIPPAPTSSTSPPASGSAAPSSSSGASAASVSASAAAVSGGAHQSDPVLQGMAAAQALSQQQQHAAEVSQQQDECMMEGVLYDDATATRLQEASHGRHGAEGDPCDLCELPPVTPVTSSTTSAAAGQQSSR
eukprot:CAMPEP_0202858940 /NCGR_PEP_ID=MMETSP1391-20130828/1265_1 /ASSEMBLY_ACC=CAM_ASM_000867 /TAXON_ID=1034604 /ORGANISM="Chlamydomonas leiostraca, Strain SAG 11-49" /LENGTH=659 /DNA_ID=CAMNT_0049537923 /DNA_START=118 /DNA_END=2097 /DNA_ORIENTATION=+